MPLKVNLAHHPLHPFGVVADLSHVLAQDPPGHVLRWGGAAPPQQLHEHERLVDMWLMRIRSAMYARRRRKAAEGGGGMRAHLLERCRQSFGSRPQCRTASTTMLPCLGTGR